VTSLLQAPVRTEEGLVGPGHHVRGTSRNDAVAAGAGVGLVPAAQVAHGEVGPTRSGLGARHGGEAVARAQLGSGDALDDAVADLLIDRGGESGSISMSMMNSLLCYLYGY